MYYCDIVKLVFSRDFARQKGFIFTNNELLPYHYYALNLSLMKFIMILNSAEFLGKLAFIRQQTTTND